MTALTEERRPDVDSAEETPFRRLLTEQFTTRDLE